MPFLADIPQFQISVAEKDNRIWFCFKIETGLFQDYVFMVAEDDKEGFKFVYGMLERENGKEIIPLDPTPEAAKLAITLSRIVTDHRQIMLDKYMAPMYNRG